MTLCGELNHFLEITGSIENLNSCSKCVPILSESINMQHIKTPKLNHIGGRVIISKSDPQSLVNDLIRASEKGMIQGVIYFCD